MGRTVPSFRIAEAQEVSEWKPFRKALPKRDRGAFDQMLNSARLYTSASSAAVRTSRFEGMAMALVFITTGCSRGRWGPSPKSHPRRTTDDSL